MNIDINKAKGFLNEAQALMYVDVPPGKNEIEAYQKITAALALLEPHADVGRPRSDAMGGNEEPCPYCVGAEMIDAHTCKVCGRIIKPPEELKDNSLPPCSDCPRAEGSCGSERLTRVPEEAE